MVQKYIIIQSKNLLNPAAVADLESDLDLSHEERYYPYAKGYLRLLSDLGKLGYKIVLAVDRKEDRDITELKRLLGRCDSLGIDPPDVEEMLLSELDFEEDPDDSFIFCDQGFEEDRFDGCKKIQVKLNFQLFYERLSELYLNVLPSPANVFARVVKYSEYFIDKRDDIYLPDKFPLERIAPNELLKWIDEAASSFSYLTADQWKKITQIKSWVENKDPVFLSKKIVGLSPDELGAYKPQIQSAYGVNRFEREEYFSDKEQELKGLLDGFLPGYIDQVEKFLDKLRKKKDALNHSNQKRASARVDELLTKLEANIFWLKHYYSHVEDRSFVQLYGLISSVEDGLSFVDKFFDENNPSYGSLQNDKLSGWDIVKNIGYFFLATIFVIPLAVHSILYAINYSQDKRTTFVFFSPQNEAIRLHKEAADIVGTPARGIEVR